VQYVQQVPYHYYCRLFSWGSRDHDMEVKQHDLSTDYVFLQMLAFLEHDSDEAAEVLEAAANETGQHTGGSKRDLIKRRGKSMLHHVLADVFGYGSAASTGDTVGATTHQPVKDVTDVTDVTDGETAAPSAPPLTLRGRRSVVHNRTRLTAAGMLCGDGKVSPSCNRM
jgi:hypothetical protein